MFVPLPGHTSLPLPDGLAIENVRRAGSPALITFGEYWKVVIVGQTAVIEKDCVTAGAGAVKEFPA